jgi:hypothetical protein
MPSGQIIARTTDTWLVRLYQGRDPATGKRRYLSKTVGSVASFGTEQEFTQKMSFLGTLGGHFEEFVDELILTPDATPAQPPHLALPNYVHRLIALNRS